MESKLDWLTLTMKPENSSYSSEDNCGKAINVLREQMLLDDLFMMLEYKGSARHYGMRFLYQDIDIRIADADKFNEQGLCISMSSNGLAYFEEYLANYGMSLRLWCARFRALCTEGWVVKCTRFDYAMDDKAYGDERPKLTMKRVLTSICDDEVSCSARTFSDNGKDFYSFKRNYKRRGGQGLWGTTVQLGQREGEGVIVRFYDKLIEQKQANKVLPDDLKSWVRCEYEYKGCEAMCVFNAWLDLTDKEYSTYMCARAMDKVRFIYRTSTNVTRCPVKRWWKEFLNGCTKRIAAVKQKPVRTALARAERGLKQYARVNYTFLREFGLDGFGKIIKAMAAELAQKGKETINREIINNIHEGARHREEMDGFKWFDYTTDVSSKALRGFMSQDRYTYNQQRKRVLSMKEDWRQQSFEEVADVYRGHKVVGYGV